MSIVRLVSVASLALPAFLLSALQSARAAESYDNCTGFIDSVPAVISTQGVWCLRGNLGTNISSHNSNAITIAANNVTIDCNHFKLGGLAAGTGSYAKGIHALDKQNVVIRHCNIRGFYRGIWLDGGANHLVEDNRLDNNLYIGIQVEGDNNLVQRNQVHDTGGAHEENTSYGIYAEADVIDNAVVGAFATSTQTHPNVYLEGIRVLGAGSVARDNRVRGLQISTPGQARGIYMLGIGTSAYGNHVAVQPGTNGHGIHGAGVSATACSNNVVAGFVVPMAHCLDSWGNAAL